MPEEGGERREFNDPDMGQIWGAIHKLELRITEQSGRMDTLEERIDALSKWIDELKIRIGKIDQRLWVILASIILSILVTILTRLM